LVRLSLKRGTGEKVVNGVTQRVSGLHVWELYVQIKMDGCEHVVSPM